MKELAVLKPGRCVSDRAVPWSIPVGTLGQEERPSLARRPTRLAEPGAVFFHACALFGWDLAAAGGEFRRARGGAPAAFHAVVGVVGDFQSGKALVDFAQAQAP